MSFAKASVWSASSTLIKIGAGLLMIKLMAIAFGPAGVGLAGNFRQLLTVLGVLSGAGIMNGITKYVAEYQQQPLLLRKMLGTASCFILLFSVLLALVFLLAAEPICDALFGHRHFTGLIRLMALIQLGIAYTNYCLAVLKGYRDARGNALVVISGSLLGVVVYYLCYLTAGYLGTLAGLALVPAIAAIPAGWMLFHYHPLQFSDFFPKWDRASAQRLGKFTLMTLMTAVTMPVAYVIMRNLLARYYTWDMVGIWQGMCIISDAYLQFITVSFSVYLLPTLASLKEKKAVTEEVIRSLRFVLAIMVIVSLAVWLLRDVIIWLLFSSQFSTMRDLFVWQLTGDVLKVGAYVFGYLVIAKASLRFYVLTELSQFVLLMLFSHWFIPGYGAVGAAQAYMATYIVYFLLCATVFAIYCKRP